MERRRRCGVRQTDSDERGKRHRRGNHDAKTLRSSLESEFWESEFCHWLPRLVWGTVFKRSHSRPATRQVADRLREFRRRIGRIEVKLGSGQFYVQMARYRARHPSCIRSEN
jgi:hypothetical protein